MQRTQTARHTGGPYNQYAIKKAVEAAFFKELAARGTRLLKTVPTPFRRQDGRLAWIGSARIGCEYKRKETVFIENSPVWDYSVAELEKICSIFGVVPDMG